MFWPLGGRAYDYRPLSVSATDEFAASEKLSDISETTAQFKRHDYQAATFAAEDN